MPCFECSRTYPVAPEELWEVVSTPRWDLWVPNTLDVRAVSGEGLGMRYQETNRVLGPLKAETRWEVVTFDAPLRQRHRGAGLPLTSWFDADFDVDPDGEGARLTLRWTPGPSGIAGRVLWALSGWSARRDLERALDALGAQLETRARQAATAGRGARQASAL